MDDMDNLEVVARNFVQPDHPEAPAWAMADVEKIVSGTRAYLWYGKYVSEFSTKDGVSTLNLRRV